MTGTVTTAAELYKVSPDFRGFMRCWVRRRRAPLPLADFLREHGLESQAACVEWCAAQPDKQVLGDLGGKCLPPYPANRTTRNVWAWYPSSLLLDSDDVPREKVRRPNSLLRPYHTATAAFLGLMDAWKESVA